MELEQTEKGLTVKCSYSTICSDSITSIHLT